MRYFLSSLVLLIVYSCSANAAVHNHNGVLCSQEFAAFYKPVAVPGEYVEDLYYESLDDVPFVTTRWRDITSEPLPVEMNNIPKFRQLSRHKPGHWVKVYRYFADHRELHYFLNETTGAIYEPKFK